MGRTRSTPVANQDVRTRSNFVERVQETCYWRDMKEEHLAAAYSLAASDILSENLFEETSFTSRFPGQTFTKMEREWIASEACAMRGNEYYDWLSSGLLVTFAVEGARGWHSGNIQSIEVEKDEDREDVFVRVKRDPDGRVFRVHVCNIRRTRG